jgi:hypothetical protein
VEQTAGGGNGLGGGTPGELGGDGRGNQGKAPSRVGLGGGGLQGWVHGGVELAGVAGNGDGVPGSGARKWRANGRNESSGSLQY